MKDLAIMLPVKNNADYLKVALNSLENQTSKEFEVVLIDDGSTDDIKSICDNYNFIINYIRNDDCQGVGHARDIGLRYIIDNKFKYLMFLDSDDKFKPNAVEVALRELNTRDVDIIQFYADVFKGNIQNVPTPSKTLWNGAFKVSTIRRLGITFNNLSISEDLYFITLLKTFKASHFLIDDNLYEHKSNNNSVTHSSNILEYGYIKSVYSICEFIENYPDTVLIDRRIASDLANLIIHCYPCHQVCKLQGTEDDDLIKMVKYILTFADNYSILNYTLFNVPSQAFVGERKSLYEQPMGLYIFRQTLDKWLQKYGFNLHTFTVYR